MGSAQYSAPSTPQQYLFSHEKLGHIVGWTRGSDVVQFRGIPYASIPGRFRQSILTSSLPSQPFEATNAGPYCPQPFQPYFEHWKAPLPIDWPVLETPRPEEFECLNLSLTIPRSSLESTGKKMPVLLFIHGGAFVCGSQCIQLSGREVFDGTRIVRHSIELGKDIIVATINYRVGPLGFLACRQLSELNEKHGEAVGNYGLHDQARAIEWLSNFVAGFGGDPNNITIQGTSAGAASCHLQCTFPERKFQRAILASGTALGIGPMPLEFHQKIYDRVVESVTRTSSSDNALEQLLSCNTSVLTDDIPWTVCHPLIEDTFIHRSSYIGAPRDDGAPDIMVGATAFEEDLCQLFLMDFDKGEPKSDGDILKQLQSTVETNHTFVDNNMFPDQFSNVFKAYNVQEIMASPSKHIEGISSLLGNILFDFPTLYLPIATYKSGSSSRIWLYRYSITNTYPASHSYRKAHHGVNDLLLFNPAPEMIPEEDRASWGAGVLQTQRSWIEFANGESPWTPVRRDLSLDSVSNLGPIFHFADHGKSREFDTLRECVGEYLVKRYNSILQISRLSI
ncbi:Alpha/Beta hydrolase protein [Cadophora sp. MPI-SDFR-AT-0126]|nr:Alpha/Beta hydrolase protein [Leotiomycetes sp. MPI-SDFR-AT-0126]